ncbi:MAG: hypothetical protein OXS33_01195 [bacterium]|nr:hypothetical protein [bacterium]
MREIDRTKAKRVARALAAFAVVSVLLSGAALTVVAQTSGGVSCSPGPSSIDVSWNRAGHTFQYTAWVKHSSGWESGQIVDPNTFPSATFSGLPLGDYTVWVVQQTIGGTWYKLGEASCTVATAETTTTTTTPTTTTTTTPPSWPGVLSCSQAGTSGLTVSVTGAVGALAWEVSLRHSSGYPKIGGSSTLGGSATGEFSTQFDNLAQGRWDVSATVTFDFADSDQRRQLTGVSCTVSSPTPATAIPPATTTTTTLPEDEIGSGTPTITPAEDEIGSGTPTITPAEDEIGSATPTITTPASGLWWPAARGPD